jgi:hypothetical protein
MERNNGLPPEAWYLLMTRIEEGRCTPFLGAGACQPTLPLGSEIAQKWAEEYEYPFEDVDNLTRVAQFLAVSYDPMFPKEAILRQFFRNVRPPDFEKDAEPHGVLASLPLPVYVTTNYDDFMVRALQARRKVPKREFCCWNKYITGHSSVFDAESGFELTAATPVVYHLHGHSKVPESLVLAEDDYLDFLVNIQSGKFEFPPRIVGALTGSSLVFIGYSLEDVSFRVVFRGIVASLEGSLRRGGVTVQLPPLKLPDKVYLKDGYTVGGEIVEESESQVILKTRSMGQVSIAKESVERMCRAEEAEEIMSRQQQYLAKYFEAMDVHVYWGTAREFAADLQHHWEEFSNVDRDP